MNPQNILDEKARKFLKLKKVLFAVWGCENTFFSTFQGESTLKDIFGKFLTFDTQTNLYKFGQEAINKMLVNLVKREKPDFIFVYLLNDAISLDTIQKIKEILPNTKIINFYGDDDTQFESISVYTSLFCDYHLVIQKDFIPLYKKSGIKNVFFIAPAIVPELKNTFENKKYDVVFIGTPVAKYRSEQIKYLLDRGINLKLFGWGWNDYPFKDFYKGKLTNEQMIKVIRQAKINLCFTKNIFGIPQVKGRIFEVGANKSFQLVERARVFSQLFKEGKELIMFDSNEDLYKKINFYLKNEKEREKIAEAAYKRVLKDYNPDSELKKLSKRFYLDRKINPKKIFNIKRRIIILNENSFSLSERQLEKKIINFDYIAFKHQNSSFSRVKDSLQAYSLEKSGKQVSCCNSYLCAKNLGVLLTFLSESSFKYNKERFCSIVHSDQLLVKKNFFLKNIGKFYNLFNGRQTNIFTEENTAFIFLPFVKIYDFRLNPHLISRDIFAFNFLENFRPLIYQRKLFTNPYIYNLIIESLFNGKFFMMKLSLKDFLNPDKFRSVKRISQKNL